MDRSNDSTLVAIELAKKSWVVRVKRPKQRRESEYKFRGLAKRYGLKQLMQALRKEHGKVISCYEAGRDGFWLHRWLTKLGVSNIVVAPHSMERKPGKRGKTDRIDAKRLLRFLRRYLEGDKGVWSEVWVPALEEESRRELTRQLAFLEKELRRQNNRMLGKLTQYGVEGVVRHMPSRRWKVFLKGAEALSTGDGAKLPQELVWVLSQGVQHLEFLEKQRADVKQKIKELQQQQEQKAKQQASQTAIAKLIKIKGLGEKSATMLDWELCRWDRFRNSKCIGKFLGLSPTPWASGQLSREQGIDKQGKAELRSLVIELGWLWVRHQPQSKLVRKWIRQLQQKGRVRRMAIVGLSRQLMVRLWLYVVRGVEIPGVKYKGEKKTA